MVDAPLADNVPPPRVYRFGPTVRLEKVTVRGSFTVTAIPGAFLNLDDFSAIVEGSGDIFLPTDCKFDRLSLQLKVGRGCLSTAFSTTGPPR